jgi:hypothetical protein
MARHNQSEGLHCPLAHIGLLVVFLAESLGFYTLGLLKVKVKVKVTLEQASKAQRGSRSIAQFFL